MLEKFMEKFSLFIKMKMLVSSSTIEILVNRSNKLVFSDTVQHWRGALYIKREKSKTLDIFTDDFEIEAMVHLSMTAKERFSLDSYKTVKDSSRFESKTITTMKSMEILSMLDYKTKKYAPSFIPNLQESWDWDNLIREWDKNTNYIDDNDLDEIRNAYIALVEARKGTWDGRAKTIPDNQTIMETVTTYSKMTSISMVEVSNYLDYRHDMFARIFCTHNNMDISNTDIPFSQFFRKELETEMKEALNKTPDLIMKNLDNSYTILEFAVTNGNWQMRLQDKADKYNQIINILSSKFNYTIHFTAIVLDMNDMEIHYYPTDSKGVMREPVTNQIHRMELMMTSIPNYSRIRALLDGDNRLYSTEVYKALEKLRILIATKDFSNLKAPSLKNSYNMDSDLDFVTNSEDAELNKLLQRTSSKTSSDFAQDFINMYSNNDINNMFGPEVRNIAKQMTEEGKETLDRIIHEKLEEERERRENSREKMPTMFKFPRITTKYSPYFLDLPSIISDELDDGTILFRKRTEIEYKEEDWAENEDKSGMGISDLDLEMFDEVCEWVRDSIGEIMTIDEVIPAMENSVLMETAKLWSVMARELTLLSERRFVKSKNASWFAFKSYDNFSLELHKGPKFSAGKQLRFRVHIILKDITDLCNWDRIFHNFYKSDNSIFVHHFETKWLTISMQDLEHLTTLPSRIRVLITELVSKAKEDNRTRTSIENRIMTLKSIPTFFLHPMIVMLEHKRNTSTSSQAARYVVHSMTSVFSDKMGVINEILSTPIRTVIQSVVVQRQFSWMLDMNQSENMSSRFLIDMVSAKGTFDRMWLKSIYDPEVEVEFSLTMFEIYYSNIFNQNLGMKSHREKAIVEKMAKEEKNFSRVKERLEEKIPFSEFLEMEDTHHIYSSDFVRTAVQNWKNKPGSAAVISDALIYAETQTLEEIIKMTRSVVSGPTKFRKFLKFSVNIEKASVLEAAMDVFSEMHEPMLSEICEKSEDIMAIFSTFSKNQFGGPREILIQAIMTRIHTGYYNAFFKRACQSLDKEMITGDRKKREKQASAAVRQKDLYLKSMSPLSRDFILPLTKNSDAAKWAPAMVMDYFIETSSEMFSNSKAGNHFLAVLRAYASKLLFVPKSLVKKWSKKPLNIRERSEDLNWVRSTMDASTGAIFFFSGMGQGNFQHPSSFFYCLMDDLTDEVMSKVLLKFGATVAMNETLISSDDCTKFLAISVPKIELMDNPTKSSATLARIITMVADITTTCRKAANIHVNWKKTAIQFAIAEFNSMFSIGKRVSLASIKSIYNSVNIVDMTFPERAVKEAISNIRSMMEDGCFLDSITTAAMEMRNNLKNWYMLDKYTQNLMSMLDCNEMEIPFQLGFLSINNILEQCIYGPEYNMCVEIKSKKLIDFYRGIYTAPIGELDEMDYLLKKEEMIAGSFKIRLNSMMSKKMEAMKAKYVRDREMLVMAMEKRALTKPLNTTMASEMSMYMENYLMDINLLYEFSDSFKINSMVRAMQLANRELETVPRIATMVDKNKSSMTISSTLTKGSKVKKVMTFENILSFCREMMGRADMDTRFDMFEPLMARAQEITAKKMELSSSTLVEVHLHSKIRMINFHDVTTDSNATETEILDCIFDDKTKAKTRVFRAVKEVSKIMKISVDDLFDNPFFTIKSVFSSSKTPFTDFRGFLSMFTKLMYNKRINMLSPFSSNDKAVDNILSLYKFLSVPGMEKVTRKGVLSSEMTNKMHDAMLFLRDEEACMAMKQALGRKNMLLSDTDTRMEWAMKVIARLIKRRKVAGKKKSIFEPKLSLAFLSSARVLTFFKRRASKEEIIFASNKSVITLTTTVTKILTSVKMRVFFYHNTPNNFEISEELRNMVYAELLKMSATMEVNSWDVSGFPLAPTQKNPMELSKVEKIKIYTKVQDLYKDLMKTSFYNIWDKQCDIKINRGLKGWKILAIIPKDSRISEIDTAAVYNIMSSEYKMTSNPEFIDDDMKENLRRMTDSDMSFSEIVTFMEDLAIINRENSNEEEDDAEANVEAEMDYESYAKEMLAMLETAVEDIDMGDLIKASANAMTDMEDLIDRGPMIEANMGEREADEEMAVGMMQMNEDLTDFFGSMFGDMTDVFNENTEMTTVEITPLQERSAFTSFIFSRMLGAFLSEYEINLSEMIRMARMKNGLIATLIFSQMKEITELTCIRHIPNEVLIYITQAIIAKTRLNLIATNKTKMVDVRNKSLYKDLRLTFFKMIDKTHGTGWALDELFDMIMD